MRKKIGTLLIVGSLGALCAGLAACSDGNKVDQFFEDGYVIKVTYDASGGDIAGGKNVTLVDMINPDHWKADANGNVHIRLKDPNATDRPTDDIKVTNGDNTLIGWYQTRNVVTVDGKAVDKDGNQLVEQDGKYYKQSGSTLAEATPAYTYADPWDFAKSTIDYNKNDGKYDLTLYAAWTEKFEFQYFYKEVKADGTDTDMEWTAYGSTKFEYSPNTEQTLYVPRWSEDSDDKEDTGRMVYRNKGFSFPSLADMTFDSAYYMDDNEELVKIDDSFKHQGYIEMETAKAVTPSHNIYVKFKKGNYYRISTPKQFANIADAKGHYTITADELDFDYSLVDNVLTKGKNGVDWPRAIMSSKFTGSIEGENGKAVTVKNVGARYALSSGAEYGGLFGRIEEGAVLKNITFENAIVDFALATYSREGNFGAFAGDIDNKATVENVSIDGHLRLGQIKMSSVNLNLIADGNTAGVTGNIALTVYGTKVLNKFEFYVNPDTAKLNEDGSIKVDLISEYAADNLRQRDNQYYQINQQIENGGEGNE